MRRQELHKSSALTVLMLRIMVNEHKFWHGQLPTSQSAMLDRVSSTHGHATRAANMGIYVAGKDHGSLSYRLSKEWSGLEEDLRKGRSLNAFKSRSKNELLRGYEAFECFEPQCRVCGDRTG